MEPLSNERMEQLQQAIEVIADMANNGRLDEAQSLAVVTQTGIEVYKLQAMLLILEELKEIKRALYDGDGNGIGFTLSRIANR